jgi:hypothetical protein
VKKLKIFPFHLSSGSSGFEPIFSKFLKDNNRTIKGWLHFWAHMLENCVATRQLFGKKK